MQKNSTLSTLIKSLKKKPLKSSPSPSTSCPYPSLSPEQLKIKLADCEQLYDELLLESLALVDIVDEINNKSSQEYEVLVEELERERLDRREDVRELQENVEISGTRLENLRVVIADKENENMALRAEIEEKDQKLMQIQQENRQNLLKLQSAYMIRLEQQIAAQIKLNNQAMSQMAQQYEARIKQIEQQNQVFLNQNELLSNRLEEIMKYVQQREKQEIVEDQISPRILCNYKEEFSPHSNHQPSSVSACSSRITSNFHKQEESSQRTSSPHRVVLHEILNTEDRKSINFGGSSILSRQRDHIHSSYGQNNFNTLNRLQSSKQKEQKQKPMPKMNIIQEFKAEESPAHDVNPYHIFFTLIAQCAKIDSGDLETVALLDLSPEWDNFLQGRVPLHEWYPRLRQVIKQRA